MSSHLISSHGVPLPSVLFSATVGVALVPWDGWLHFASFMLRKLGSPRTRSPRPKQRREEQAPKQSDATSKPADVAKSKSSSPKTKVNSATSGEQLALPIITAVDDPTPRDRANRRAPLQRTPRSRSLFDAKPQGNIQPENTADEKPAMDVVANAVSTTDRQTELDLALQPPAASPKTKTKRRSGLRKRLMKADDTKLESADPQSNDSKASDNEKSQTKQKSPKRIARHAGTKAVAKNSSNLEANPDQSSLPIEPIRHALQRHQDEHELPMSLHISSTENSVATVTAPELQKASTLLSRCAPMVRALPPSTQPEVHIIGEIVRGSGFGNGSFCCKWSLECGPRWQHIAGDRLGQTQLDTASSDQCGGRERVVWSHPIDLHMATTTLQGWPRLLLQVWRVDTHMTANVVGYGFITVPFAPGSHTLIGRLWRPLGSTAQELQANLLGLTLELATDQVLFATAPTDRCRLQTIATGEVEIEVDLLLRHFPLLEFG